MKRPDIILWIHLKIRLHDVQSKFDILTILKIPGHCVLVSEKVIASTETGRISIIHKGLHSYVKEWSSICLPRPLPLNSLYSVVCILDTLIYNHIIHVYKCILCT